MRPFALARAWKASADEVLGMFLHATRLGLLNLIWELMCPNCRVPKAEYKTLAELSNQFHCDMCGINYDANFDQYVELCFSVNPRVRRARDQVYCVGGLYHVPHIVSQQHLAPGGERAFSVPVTGDTMRFRVLRYNHVALLLPHPFLENQEGKEWQSGKLEVKDEADSQLQLIYRDEGWHP